MLCMVTRGHFITIKISLKGSWGQGQGHGKQLPSYFPPSDAAHA